MSLSGTKPYFFKSLRMSFSAARLFLFVWTSTSRTSPSASTAQIFDVAETQGEPDIKPDRLLDDFVREAVAAIADLSHHRWLRLKVTDGKPNGDVTMPS